MSRYTLRPSKIPGFWVATDTEHGIVVKFEDHRFNDTQQVTLFDDVTITAQTANDYALYMRELADWLRNNHYSKIF